MAQTFERAQSRLDNIKSIDPLLSALRTLSMGAWQMALNKLAKIQSYEKNYSRILKEILPHISDKQFRPSGKKKGPPIASAIILIIGSERGLCGKFNQILALNALAWIKEQKFPSYQVWAMGNRLIRELERMKVDISWSNPLPASDVPTYQDAYSHTQNWLSQFESYDFNQLFLIHNQIKAGSNYQFGTLKLLPYELNTLETEPEQNANLWPPSIIETEPDEIYHQIIEQRIALSFYQVLLKSAAAEHSSRYSLMQDAKDNAEDIVEELNRIINTERKRKITQEMQELASGAGLLDN